jgi:hypothetical protein
MSPLGSSTNTQTPESRKRQRGKRAAKSTARASSHPVENQILGCLRLHDPTRRGAGPGSQVTAYEGRVVDEDQGTS